MNSTRLTAVAPTAMDTALMRLCEALAVDGATLTGRAVKSAWRWVRIGPIPHAGSEHVEPVLDGTGAVIGELRLVWRARRRRLKPAERVAVSAVARLVGATHAAPIEGETQPDRVFRQAPVSLWEEDLTGLEHWARERRAEGVSDFTAYFSTVPGSIHDALGHIRILAVNPAGLKSLGLPPDTHGIEGIPDAAIVHANPEGWAGLVEAMLAREPVIRLEISSTSPAGERVWAILEGQAAEGEDGPDYGRVIVAATDVTALKRAQERLTVHATLLDIVHNAVIVTDAHGRITFWNRHASEMYGWTAEEAIGSNVSELIVPADVREEASEIMADLDVHGVWSGEFPVQHKDGTVFPALVTDVLTVDANGERTGIVGVSSDLSELRASESREHSHAEMARAVLDSLPSATAVIDSQGVVTHANAAWDQTGGVIAGRPVVVGASYFEACAAGAAEGVSSAQRSLEGIRDVLAGRRDRFSLEFSAPSGARWTRLDVVPLPSTGGAVVSHLDVTAEYTARTTRTELLGEKLHFIASVSHQLRTPLTAVVGFAEVLRDPSTSLSEEERADILDVLYRQALETGALVQDLIVTAQSELGDIGVDIRPVSVMREVQRIVASLSESGSDIRISGDDVIALADDLRLRQILRNLIANAVRHGGPTVGIDITERSECVGTVVVWDDGPPVDENLRHSMFLPFTNGHREKSNPATTGLGLTVAKRLADAMRATLTYHHDGDRSRFELDFPRSEDCPEECPEEPCGTARQSKNLEDRRRRSTGRS